MGGEDTVVAAATMSRVDVGRVVRKGGLRRSATGFAVAGGWRTDEVAGQTLSMGSGPALLATLRHDRRRLSFEARMGLEREVVSSSTFQIETLGLSLTAAALLPIDFRVVTLSLGVEVGWVLIRQGYSTTGDEWMRDGLPATPALMHPRWSDGLQLGPLAQLDFPVGRRSTCVSRQPFPIASSKAHPQDSGPRPPRWPSANGRGRWFLLLKRERHMNRKAFVILAVLQGACSAGPDQAKNYYGPSVTLTVHIADPPAAEVGYAEISVDAVDYCTPAYSQQPEIKEIPAGAEEVFPWVGETAQVHFLAGGGSHCPASTFYGQLRFFRVSAYLSIPAGPDSWIGAGTWAPIGYDLVYDKFPRLSVRMARAARR